MNKVIIDSGMSLCVAINSTVIDKKEDNSNKESKKSSDSKSKKNK